MGPFSNKLLRYLESSNVKEGGELLFDKVSRHWSTDKCTSSYLNLCNALELLKVVAFPKAEIACHDAYAQKYRFGKKRIEFAPLL
jgi:hypothetical protein